MKVNIIFPCDYFNKNQVEYDYQSEYLEAIKFNFNIILFDYDYFVQEDKIQLYPNIVCSGICIYRGWMLKPEQYKILYDYLNNKGVTLINTPQQYSNCHLFPNSYLQLKGLTPGILVFDNPLEINWNSVKNTFKRFMLKDYVKSVKDCDFPKYFDNTYTDQQLNEYTKKFLSLRGSLFTGGIVIKEFINLEFLNETTNEYRVFYLYDKTITIAKNSNQPNSANPISQDFIKRIPALDSNFYTVDFAELKNGEWIVIETGDGQVSGLSPNQYVFKFFEEIQFAFNTNS